MPIPGAATPPEVLLGTYAPQPPPKIEQLGFSTFDDYLAAFEKALQAQVQAGYLLEDDKEVLLERADLFPSETFTENYYYRYNDFRSGEYCP